MSLFCIDVEPRSSATHASAPLTATKPILVTFPPEIKPGQIYLEREVPQPGVKCKAVWEREQTVMAAAARQKRSHLSLKYAMCSIPLLEHLVDIINKRCIKCETPLHIQHMSNDAHCVNILLACDTFWRHADLIWRESTRQPKK